MIIFFCIAKRQDIFWRHFIYRRIVSAYDELYDTSLISTFNKLTLITYEIYIFSYNCPQIDVDCTTNRWCSYSLWGNTQRTRQSNTYNFHIFFSLYISCFACSIYIQYFFFCISQAVRVDISINIYFNALFFLYFL